MVNQRRVTEPEVTRAMRGETVFVPLPGGMEGKLMMRRRMLYLTVTREPSTIKRETMTGGRDAKGGTLLP